MATGVINSATVGQTPDLVAKSFGKTITRLMPNGAASLFGFTSYLDSETATQPEHGFFTKTMIFPAVVMAASATATDTLLNVVSTANITPGMMLQNVVGAENMLVQAVVSPTQLFVARGTGTISTSAIASGVQLNQIGTAFEEGSLRPQSLTIAPIRITNYTQIFRNSWAVTDSARATLTIAGDGNVKESRMDCATFHAADIEKSLIFGQKSFSYKNNQPLRTMDGVNSIVSNLTNYPSSYSSANVSIAGATTNYTQLEAMLDPAFNQVSDMRSSKERILFVGGRSLLVINTIGRLNGTYQVVQGQTDFGLQFSTFRTSRGVFTMIEHPLFNSNAVWAKRALCLDLSGIKLAYLGNRKTMSATFNQEGGDIGDDNGIDALGGTLTTELTLVMKNPPSNAIIENLTAGAAG